MWAAPPPRGRRSTASGPWAFSPPPSSCAPTSPAPGRSTPSCGRSGATGSAPWPTAASRSNGSPRSCGGTGTPAALASGAVLVTARPGAALGDQLAEPYAAGITVLDLPTPYWHHLGADLGETPWPDTLRLVVLGADQVRAEPVAAWRARFGDTVRLVNSYGPTETAVIATTAELGAADGLHGSFNFNTDLVDASDIARLADHLGRLLRSWRMPPGRRCRAWPGPPRTNATARRAGVQRHRRGPPRHHRPGGRADRPYARRGRRGLRRPARPHLPAARRAGRPDRRPAGRRGHRAGRPRRHLLRTLPRPRGRPPRHPAHRRRLRPAGTGLPRRTPRLPPRRERRTRIASGDGGEPRQRLYSQGLLEVRVHDVPEPAEAPGAADALLSSLVARRFDYADEWPLRFGAVRHEGRITHVLLALCHLAADGHAAEVLVRDLRLLARRGSAGPACAGNPLDLAHHQASPAGRRSGRAALAHWERGLRAAPPTMFPTPVAEPRPPLSGRAGWSPPRSPWPSTRWPPRTGSAARRCS